MSRGWIHVHVLTMDGEDRTYPDGGILYTEDGTISAVGESGAIRAQAEAEGARLQDGGGKILLPGLVNTHTHLYQELTKGRGSDLSLEEWFPKAMAPVGAALRPRHMEAGVDLGILEALRSGVTTVADYMQHQPVPGLGIAELERAKALGIRMVYGRGYRDIGRPEVVENAESIFADVDDLRARYETGDGMMTLWLAPAASWGLSDSLMRQTRAYAGKTGTPIMMHLFETGSDNTGSRERFGTDAIDWFEEAGLLGPDLLAVHSVALGEKELDAYRRHGVRVSYNPVSNMYLASGVAPVRRLLDLGLTVGLGTDGAGSNNSNDMLETMKAGALLQKAFSRDPRSLTAYETLRMATIEGAKALGLDKLVGSLEAGKRADLVLYDPMASVKTCPVCGSAEAALVYTGDCRGVDTVVVNGRVLLSGGKFTQADEEAILARAQEMAQDLADCLE